jgi:large subunit ribosomal protein L22
MKAYAKNIRISPKKLSVVATIVREAGSVKNALDLLRFMPKKGAPILFKVLTSAVANAVHNDAQQAENLKLKTLIVSKGIVYKRSNPISRGRSHRILKLTSNVLLELTA